MTYYREFVKLSDGQEIAVWRISNDTSGNPRYVIHFLSVADTYDQAIKIAKTIGGKRYTAKWFGGGIVFSSYNVQHCLERLMQFAQDSQTQN